MPLKFLRRYALVGARYRFWMIISEIIAFLLAFFWPQPVG